MSQISIILISVLSSCFITLLLLIIYLSKKFSDMENLRRGDRGMEVLNQNVQSLQHLVSNQINESNRAINERLDGAARMMMAVNAELGQMKEIGLDLKNIQNFLKAPKLRGNLGEQGLRELLSQALPKKYFDVQYSFRCGVTVDAIINLENGKIPIDSKFPFENFNAMLKAETEELRNGFRRKFRDDFKKHITAISSKYIIPDEGTTEFAFMYIPSESIYFEVINNEPDLFELAAHSHVVLSSPSTFFYYLRTIMLGLEGKRMNELGKEILATLKTLQKQSAVLGENIGVLGRHISNAGKTMNIVTDQYVKLSEKMEKVDLLEENQVRLLKE